MKINDLIYKTPLSNTAIDGTIDSSMDTWDAVYIEAGRDLEHKPESDYYIYPTDYAVLCGAEQMLPYRIKLRQNIVSSLILRDCDKETPSVLEASVFSPDTTIDGKKISLSNLEFAALRNTNISICPCISMNANKLAEAIKDKEIIITFEDLPCGDNIPTIKLGEFPQKVVTDSFILDHLELCRKSGYVSPYGNGAKITKDKFITKDGKMANVYELKGKKYVPVDSAPCDFDSRLSTGEEVLDNKIYWCEVEPIVWKIQNWNDLPIDINPDGEGLTDTVFLTTAQAIISGVPFYTENDDKLGVYWQNSMIRAYLNGYDNHYEIVKNHNGNYKYLGWRNYEFKKDNFIKQAFGNSELIKNKPQSTPAEEIIKHTRRKTQSRYGVSIPKSKLTIDDQIKYYIDNRRPVMLHGKSGIGKSRRVADIDPDYFLLTLRNGMMPEEILGKECPNPNGAGTKWYAPSWYNELCEKCKNEPDKNHILFIDELTNVNEYEQSLVYHIVLNHSLGVTSGKLPENCVVVAAGNSKDESNSAYNMSEPLFRRFHGHIYLPLDLESLLEWGSEPRKDNIEQTNLHPLISNYLATYSKSIYSEYDPDKTGKNFAIDPRAWEQVSDIIYDNNGELWEELINNKIGEDNTTQLLAYAEKNFITIEDILTDNYDEEEIPTKLDEQYALALSLRHADEQEIEKVREFMAKNLSGETLAKFDFVWVGKNPERAMIIDELSKKQSYNQGEKKENILKSKLMNGKTIHINDFCGSEEDWRMENQGENFAIICCYSVEEATFLGQAFDALGRKWSDGYAYANSSTEVLEGSSCVGYSNEGTFYFNPKFGSDVVMMDEYDLNTEGHKFYDFAKIDFTGVLSSEVIDQIEKYLDEKNLKRV